MLPEALAGDADALRIENWRSSSGNVEKGSVYDYAPTVMKHGDLWKMWWCGADPAGRVAGDDILYAVSESPNGPFHAPWSSRPYRRVFEGSGGSGWDVLAGHARDAGHGHHRQGRSPTAPASSRGVRRARPSRSVSRSSPRTAGAPRARPTRAATAW
ncbi:MAG: hypothetical protein ACRDTM_16080 [Micromonosporaceae bacterium]